jgi:hypothetical protein
MIVAHGAHTAIYMVWPEKARIGVLDDVITSYTLAAESVGGILIPGGLAWKYAWQEDPSFPLYSDDDFHPSLLGSYVVALCAYGALRHRSAATMPSTFDVGSSHIEIPIAQADVARRAADAALSGGSPP